MSELREMDFSNFELEALRHGQGVYEVANGLIPEMAGVFDVDVSDQPTSDALGALVGAIGKSKVLQENLSDVQAQLGTDGDSLTIAAGWVDRSGVQTALDRSLWTPDMATPDDADGIVLTGAMANWQDRAIRLLANRAEQDGDASTVYYPVGNRIMNSPTEQANANVQAFQAAHEDEYPTEAQYAEELLLPQLVEAGYDVELIPFETTNGDEIAANFVAQYNQLLTGKLAFARVANAGIQLATQFRKAARAVRPEFDSDAADPQAYVLTDTFPVARTPEDAKNARQFQNPMTAIRQVALTAKLLHETAQQ